MNEVFILDKEFIFKDSVHEITSISIEHNYDVNGEKCEGEFLVSGDYRLHEVSINKEEFNFRIPFSLDVRSNVNLDSLELEITDFTYDVSGDTLNVHVEYQVTGEQALIEFQEEVELNEFLANNNAEVIELSEEEREEEEVIPEVVTEEREEEIIPEEVLEEVEIEEEEVVVEIERDHMPEAESIIGAINSEDNFVTYHVHTVTSSDSFETISASYNINITELKRINNIEELTLNTKLIIPDETD